MFVRLSLLAATASLTVPAFATGAQTAPTSPAATKPMTRTALIQGLDSAFKAVDTNHNGVLEKSEIAAAQAAALQKATAVEQRRLSNEFTKLDTNKDGQLSKAEFLAAAPPVKAHETPDQLLAQLDANKDGKVGPEEYRAPRLTVFDKIDANHDGTVSSQETQAVRASAARKK